MVAIPNQQYGNGLFAISAGPEIGPGNTNSSRTRQAGRTTKQFYPDFHHNHSDISSAVIFHLLLW